MSAIFPTYGRFDLMVERAKGTTVWDDTGKAFLDFTSGIGVVNLGHRHQKVQQAVTEQLDKVWHTSNLFHISLQEEVAEKLAASSSGDRVFFCNSGAEANEAAIKLARKATGKTKIITCKQSFHGRTFATMAATGQEKIHHGYGPLLESFVYVPYNDISALAAAIDENTAAIMLETIQGEGGVIPATSGFMKEIASIVKEKQILLIIDEIQTGIGRTGKPFAYQHYDISPDIITTAKALGNGLPVGAMIAKKDLEAYFGPGSHGSTFGGNPLAMAAAKQVLQEISKEAFLEDIIEKGQYLHEQLSEKFSDESFVKEVRGKGLMVGIVCDGEVQKVIQSALKEGLLVLQAGSNVLRLLPPLVVTKEEIDTAVSILYQCIQAQHVEQG
ncbi:acetylornithine transaminase [Virgibacillus halophilus]|uniref:acetylornithine transaminase n=1 Tax=Tigheibacillus halophilus TaxID=361280 RepID=UPI0036374AFA